MITAEELATWKEMLEKITPDEWRFEGEYFEDEFMGAQIGQSDYTIAENVPSESDAKFIAASPKIVRKLIEDLDCLREPKLISEVERLKGELNEFAPSVLTCPTCWSSRECVTCEWKKEAGPQ